MLCDKLKHLNIRKGEIWIEDEYCCIEHMKLPSLRKPKYETVVP